MKIKIYFFAAILIFSAACSRQEPTPVVTTESMLGEMVDLNRLTVLPEHVYRAVQFSSYDRRSTAPDQEGWFANEDGFGGEPVPGFEKVLVVPDLAGTGRYLICDVRGPGAIVRLWTAGISGKIRLFLDDMNTPLYNGSTEDFFWKTPDMLTGRTDLAEKFRQFDAVYFPVPFAKRCRIEWTGNLKDIHFYHVGFRIYDPEVLVVPFPKAPSADLLGMIEETGERLSKNKFEPEQGIVAARPVEAVLAPARSQVLWQKEGAYAIDYLSIRAEASDAEAVLRKCVLSIYFDGSQTPQVQAPLGDFFGAAPGINPFQSLPFSVEKNGNLICRFVMPFQRHARIEVENHSGEKIQLFTVVRTSDYKWEDGRSMHFRARWRVDHEITASDQKISDITFLMAHGKGRIVGASTYIYNPSNVPTSWGNWWGEGDEKIFVDRDTFPSFFGTGSEDYYNYSWSSALIFSYPYCGQPRNDGPGNRGYVANFRWHILDDIPFNENLDFKMELRHHGAVPRFSHGRIVHFYALPGLHDDYQPISMDDLRDLPYYEWNPEAYLGSAGFRFDQAEDLAEKNPAARVEVGKYWAGGKILMWKPLNKGDQIRFILKISNHPDSTNLGFTLAKMPDGGSISVLVNEKKLRCNGEEIISLFEENQTVLDNYFTEKVKLNRGTNEIIFESRNEKPEKRIGIDFLWIQKPPDFSLGVRSR
ncbi:MAG: DUF2961 domain-containing protein [Bacteroidia bacterium]|nr:DUF2961 domain-containing protein [Bacteroidia bacterium]